MNGVPLHPSIVHFPIVLTFLLPIFALGAWWAIARGARVTRAWLIPVALGAALLGSAFIALETGESEGEKVERVVGEAAISKHEEAAERFLVLSGVLFVILGVGLMRGGVGRFARGLGTAGAVAMIAAAVQVGHAGGELVYQQGAASVYNSKATSSAAGTGAQPTVDAAAAAAGAQDAAGGKGGEGGRGEQDHDDDD